MALKKIIASLFDEKCIFDVFQKYVHSTGEYNLPDRLDMTPMLPTFNAALTSVDVFNTPHARKLSFPLSLLIPDMDMGTILAELTINGIGHGHIFEIPSRGYDVLPYYRVALNLLPPAHMAQLMFWKRAAHTATEMMLQGRRQIWEEIWRTDLSFKYSFHPAIMLSMTSYKGPIPLFLQKVSAYMIVEIGGDHIDMIFRTIVCQDWFFPKSVARFTSLWHQIMKETACVYIPLTEKKNERRSESSSISFHVGDQQWLSNADKFLCLLLALFHRPYKEKIAAILQEEPTVPFLADIFARYPTLYPKILSNK